MKDLIERLEKASEGNRLLDAEIGRLIASEHDDRTRPLWTTSLDAALTLVPEGWGGRIYLSGAVSLWSDGPDLGAVCRALAKNETPREPTKKVVGSSDCGSPALALCIAALKARRPA